MFEAQDPAHRARVIGRGTARVAVEAAMRQGRDRYVGEDGGFVGMSGCGVSGPEAALWEHFGFTPEAVAAQVRARL